MLLLGLGLRLDLGLALALAVALPGLAGAQAVDPATSAPGAAEVLGIEGQVEYLGAGAARWHKAYAGQLLDPGDRLRTGARSRVLLRFANRETFRLDERGVLEVPQKSRWSGALDLLRGALYFFHRDRPDHLEMRTRLVQAVVRGTEFVVKVEDDGTTTFHLMDGELWLTNAAGALVLRSGESARVEAGTAPRPTASLRVQNAIQWCLYYPNILDLDELALAEDSRAVLADSLASFRRGNLLAAADLYPPGRQPDSAGEGLYLAALLLSVGRVNEAEEWIKIASTSGAGSSFAEVATALRRLVTIVNRGAPPGTTSVAPKSSSGWLGESYARQATGDLAAARAAANEAVRRAPGFSFAWSRLAELEFSFGRRPEARRAIERGLALAPENAQAIAIRGFLLASESQLNSAEAEFARAIAQDPALGNGWLGRGLVRIARGERDAGLADLQSAATVEPQRSEIRSCLAKALALVGDDRRAVHELGLAKALEPRDPTPWYYSALLLHQQNRVNAGIRELERSRELNDNRQVHRSRFLLDQDQAVRGANLANLYHDAGLTDVAMREAAEAVSLDYANYSAHLFLANVYDQLRDPQQLNLRYETPWLAEYLMANLLAPAAAGIFSPTISQQDYGRLFEYRPWGIASATDYFSSGDWTESAAHFGNLDRLSYSLEGSYRRRNGQRPNNDLERSTVWARTRWQVSPADSIWLEVVRDDLKSGDVRTLYSRAQASETLRVREREEPLVLVGYHREWAPGHHTVALAGRLEDRLIVTNNDQTILELDRYFDPPAAGFYPHAQAYRNHFEIFSGEVQQIAEQGAHRVVSGARLQSGTFVTDDSVDAGDYRRRVEAGLVDASGYLYWSWDVVPRLTLIGGMNYEYLEYPANHRFSPITAGEQSAHRWNPKAGVVWNPAPPTTVRAAYTESLGGVSFDQSIRLEPTQVGGINQAYRSLIPESVAGANTAPRLQMAGLSVAQRLRNDLHLGLSGEWLRSTVRRRVGVLSLEQDPGGSLVLVPGAARQSLRFDEQAILVTAHQLLGDEWALGARYRVSRTGLESGFDDLGADFPGLRGSTQTAISQQADVFAVFNHPAGPNARGEATWMDQTSDGYHPARGREDFWQFNTFIGYRWPRRQVELRCGVLNLTARDYRLDPLSVTSERPRERTFVAQLRFSF